MKQILKLTAIMLTLLSSAHALENADILKLVAELKNENPATRANALKQLTPFLIEMNAACFDAPWTGTQKSLAAYKTYSEKYSEAAMKSRPKPVITPLMTLEHNEVIAVSNCKAFCTAQEIYRRTDYNNDGVLEYAKTLKGNNSLYENKAGTADIQLIDKTFADAEAGPGNTHSKNGYFFKVLTKQGSHATGGAKDYVKDGRMVLGYAFLVYPAEYGKTGKNCFIVNNAGVIYHRDFGPDTCTTVQKITEFDPEPLWVPEQ